MIEICDDFLPENIQHDVLNLLNEPGWVHGWKSDSTKDQFAFFHKHFAGAISPDNYGGKQYDCEDDLKEDRFASGGRLLLRVWKIIRDHLGAGHTLVRCYANGYPYGSEGTAHTDSINDTAFTTIYYPHQSWHVDWGGETVFFDRDQRDVIGCCFPKPNRLLTFAGTIPHAARPITRLCPALRITLMMKTETHA